MDIGQAYKRNEGEGLGIELIMFMATKHVWEVVSGMCWMPAVAMDWLPHNLYRHVSGN